MNRCYLAFLRHAEYQQTANHPSAWQPFPLTDAGQEQSIAAGKTLANLMDYQNWQLYSEIFSSNLLRSWQTASLIRQQFSSDAQITTSKALNERSVGALANLSVTEIEAVIAADPRFDALPPHWKSNSEFRLPVDGAESLMQAGQRVSQFINDQVRHVMQNAEQPTLIIMVGHGAAFRHAAYHLGIMDKADIGRYSMHYAQPMVFECRLDKQQLQLDLLAGKWKVRAEADRPD